MSWFGSYIKQNEILIKHKHLKAILDGKPVYLEDGKVVVNEPRRPLITSVDGFELFEGDEYQVVFYHKEEWMLGDISKLNINLSTCIHEPKRHKAFKHKENALNWVEEMNNKPKVDDVVTNGRLFKRLKPMSSVSSRWHKVSKQEVIKLLFDEN